MDLVHIRIDFDAPSIVHRLCGIVAKIEDHLLQLRGLTGHEGSLRRCARKVDPRRQRGVKQRFRLGDQGLHAYGPAAHVATPAESENLIYEIARSLSRSADCVEIAGCAVVGCELRFRDLCVAENRTQDIVEVVRDTASKGTHRLHAAGLLQACLQAPSFAFEDTPPQGTDNRIERIAQQAEFVGFDDWPAA
jgi:hypothetical protein